MAPGPTKGLFGVMPQELVGKPLTAFINVFADWKSKVTAVIQPGLAVDQLR